MTTNQPTEGTTISEIERIVRAGTVHHVDDTPLALVPPGYKVESLERLQESPRRIRAKVNLHTLDAFIAYAAKWNQGESSALFADEANRAVHAVFDYHEAADRPDWCDHKASYTAQLSRELKAWLQWNGNALPQVDFAEFLEERIKDVTEPTGAHLLELATKLQVIRKAVFGSAVRLATGEFQFQWSDENQKGTVEIPERITLGIPLFHGGEAYKITARLRYRVADGKVSFIYKLDQIEDAIEHAFAEQIAKVKAALPKVPLYQGSFTAG